MKGNRKRTERELYPSDKRTHILQQLRARPVSPRELKVLTKLGDGYSTPEIRQALGVSKQSVNTYIERLKTKLAAANLNQLIRLAVLLREGILPANHGGKNVSFRICPRCHKPFEVRPTNNEVSGLAGYRVLDAVLRNR
jgi:DNA-binding CsgD family transcriptional regulator